MSTCNYCNEPIAPSTGSQIRGARHCDEPDCQADRAAQAAYRAAVGAPAAPSAALSEGWCRVLVWARDGDALAAVALSEAVCPALLAQLAVEDCSLARHWVGSNPATPPTALERLARTGDLFERVAVAGNPAAPARVLRLLGAHRVYDVRAAVAGNRRTPADELETLAGDPDVLVRWPAASNPRTPASALEALVPDADGRTIDLLAANPALPLRALRMLVAGPAPPLVAAAKNPAAPDDVIELLAGDPDVEVRAGVAANPATTPRLLALLAIDPHDLVRLQVAMHSGSGATLRGLAHDASPEVRQAAVRNSHLPAPMIEELARADDPAMVRAVAANRACPGRLLWEIADGVSDWSSALYEIARSPATPTDLLQRLMGHDASDIRRAASWNPNARNVALSSLSPLNRLIAIAELAGPTSPEVAETILALSADWEGSLSELEDCARAL